MVGCGLQSAGSRSRYYFNAELGDETGTKVHTWHLTLERWQREEIARRIPTEEEQGVRYFVLPWRRSALGEPLGEEFPSFSWRELSTRPSAELKALR